MSPTRYDTLPGHLARHIWVTDGTQALLLSSNRSRKSTNVLCPPGTYAFSGAFFMRPAGEGLSVSC